MAIIYCKECHEIIPNEATPGIHRRLEFIARRARKGHLSQESMIAEMYPICSQCVDKLEELWHGVDQSRDPQHNPDPNVNASRIVAEATRDEKRQPADVESAWLAWSAQIQQVDEGGMSLLKAAFEAGYDAASSGAGGT